MAKEQYQAIKQTAVATKSDVDMMNRVVQLVLSNGEGMEAPSRASASGAHHSPGLALSARRVKCGPFETHGPRDHLARMHRSCVRSCVHVCVFVSAPPPPDVCA